MFVIVLLFPLLFLACGEAELKIQGEEYERLYKEDQELRYNHLLLKAYFYHPERVKTYDEYKGMEVDTMYESLKDYFCGAYYVGPIEDCPYRYTYYIPPEESDETIGNIENTKRYYSFGFERKNWSLNKDGSVDLVVSAVYPISPAFSAGLKRRDKLLFANGVPLTNLTEENADYYTKNDDPFDDPTVFTVLRNGNTITLPAMQKREVQEPTVYLDTLDELSIPYIQVKSYKVSTNNPNGTYAEFQKVLQEIKGAKVAVMELRNNLGGNIRHCSSMAAELVPPNSMLLYDVRHYYDSQRGNVIDTMPDYARSYLTKEGEGMDTKWIILINRWSASCSERFVAAVKYNRPETVVIGEKSYGKGVGQIYTKTSPLGGLAYITCLQTYYPNGETFHNIGVIPDKYAVGNADIYDKIVEAVRGFGGLAKRSPTPAISGALPPLGPLENMEPGAYIKIETPLFHQGE